VTSMLEKEGFRLVNSKYSSHSLLDCDAV